MPIIAHVDARFLDAGNAVFHSFLAAFCVSVEFDVMLVTSCHRGMIRNLVPDQQFGPSCDLLVSSATSLPLSLLTSTILLYIADPVRM